MIDQVLILFSTPNLKIIINRKKQTERRYLASILEEVWPQPLQKVVLKQLRNIIGKVREALSNEIYWKIYACVYR